MLYSVIIPAYNEAEFLPRTLTYLRKAIQTIDIKCEVIVVDNNSQDNTSQIAEEYGAAVFFEKINQISRARNRGGKHAAGEYLIFLDADTIIKPDTLKRALKNLAAGCCGGGALVDFDKPIPGYAQKLARFWNFISLKYNLAAGSFLYCLKDGFMDIKGFSESVYAGEEIWFSKRLKAWGQKRNKSFLVIKDYPVITSSRKLEWYTFLEIALQILILTLFPPATRFRLLCSSWYRRPKK